MPIILPDNTRKRGSDGKPITTKRPNSDSGVFIRGAAQVNLWCWPVGSGYIEGYGNANFEPSVRAGVVPKSRVDKPIGQWNTMQITVLGEQVTVVQKGQAVLDKARLPGLARQGPIGFQYHIGRNEEYGASSLVQLRNIRIKRMD